MTGQKKKLLFIGNGFYDYDNSIKKQFEDFGFSVDYFCETTYTLTYRYYYRKKQTKKVTELIEKKVRKIAEKCRSDYNYVFVIKGAYLTPNSIVMIKKKNPGAILILYLYDSLARIPNFQKIHTFFDQIYSFDRIDCQSNKLLHFHPLFYRKEYSNLLKSKSENIDLYFFGWFHSDRFAMAKFMIDFCKENHLVSKVKLYTGLFSFIGKWLTDNQTREYWNIFIFKPMSKRMHFRNLANSRCVLDIAHPLQSGLTIRTIEMVGAQKKIITTNADIVNYDFYNPKNILIIDRNSPNLMIDFFKTSYVPIERNIVNKYSIKHWVETIFKHLPESKIGS